MADTVYPNANSLAHPHFAMWTENFAGKMLFSSSQFNKNPKNLYMVPGDYTDPTAHPKLMDPVPCAMGGQKVLQWYYALVNTQPATNNWCSDIFTIGWNAAYQGECSPIKWEIRPWASSPGVDPLNPEALKMLPTWLCGANETCPDPASHDCCKLDASQGGPSQLLRTPIWSSTFQSFIVANMGVWSPECEALPREWIRQRAPYDWHPCAASPTITKNAPKILVNSNPTVKCSPPTPDCAGSDYCADRELDNPDATDFDRPESLSSTWTRMGGAHLGETYKPWSFSRYEYRYINFGDPREEYAKEYHLDQSSFPTAPDCGSPGTNEWDNLKYFHDGIKMCWPKCEDGSLAYPSCTPPDEPVPSPWPGRGKVMFDGAYMGKHTNCWIGWEGGVGLAGGGGYPVPFERGSQDKDYAEGFEDWPDHDDEKFCPPEPMESEKHFFHLPPGSEGIALDVGKFIPHQYWVSPNKRLFDYWTIFGGVSTIPGNENKCKNFNIAEEGNDLTNKQKNFFQPHNQFFHDPAFSKDDGHGHEENKPTWYPQYDTGCCHSCHPRCCPYD